MECKDCKIICDGTEIATIKCGNDEGFSINYTEKGKKMYKELSKGCC